MNRIILRKKIYIYISEPITGPKKLINESNYIKEKIYIFEPITESKKLNPEYMTQLIEDNNFYKN